MNIGLCYEQVVPSRGGCETYISDFTRRLIADGHEVHLYATRWDALALPASLRTHAIPQARGPRFMRPWRFAGRCERAMRCARHDVTIGFDKTWGQDVLYPQGGLHAASAQHNIEKHAGTLTRWAAGWAKCLDPAHRSFAALEHRQYLGKPPAAIVVNSEMVREHFQMHYSIGPERIQVVHAAIDPARFDVRDRPMIRHDMRLAWGCAKDERIGLFLAMNYRLKGLEPLLHAIALVPQGRRFRIVVAGHPNFARYQRLAERLGVRDRVIFHGFCADARRAYFAADFLVHPTFYDPCSLVVLEALACGLPVVTTRCNGAAELLHPPHDGLVVDTAHDHARLADAIESMLNDAYRDAAAVRARESAALWTFNDHCRKMMSILESTAHSRAEFCRASR